MYSYDPLIDALNDLNKRSYTYDFNIRDNCVHCDELKRLDIDVFNVDEHYRFEGASDPGDLSEVYTIEITTGIKGVLTDGYGISAELSPEMIEKLRFRV